MPGLPLRFVLTAGQASDKTTAPSLVDGLPAPATSSPTAATSPAPSSSSIQASGATATSPARATCGSVVGRPSLYRKRNLIERFFNKLKHFRRIATRYDKLARTSSPPCPRRSPPLDPRLEFTT